MYILDGDIYILDIRSWNNGMRCMSYYVLMVNYVNIRGLKSLDFFSDTNTQY